MTKIILIIMLSTMGTAFLSGYDCGGEFFELVAGVVMLSSVVAMLTVDVLFSLGYL